MGIAMLTFSGLVQGWAALQRLAHDRAAHSSHRPTRALRMVHPSGQRTVGHVRLATPSRNARPSALRVLRVCDAQPMPGEVGRLRISGRMADVCAELDRLAAQEAATARH